MTVRELRRRMTTDEYTDWIAYYRQESKAMDKAQKQSKAKSSSGTRARPRRRARGRR